MESIFNINTMIANDEDDQRIIVAIKDALKSNPEDANLLSLLAQAYSTVGKKSLAKKYAAKAFECGKRNLLAIYIYARVREWTKDYSGAIKGYRKIADGQYDLPPDSAGFPKKWAESIYIDSFFDIAYSYSKVRDFDNAIIWVLKHLDKRQKGLSYWTKKEIEGYLELWRSDKAITMYHSARDKENWLKAIDYLYMALEYDKTEHWLWIQLSGMYLHIDEPQKALRAALKAYKLTKKCPETLFYYAYSLELNNKLEEARLIYRKIINKGVEELAYGVCGEGIRYGRGYYIDSMYRIGMCYLKEDRKGLAKRYIQKHLENRNRNCESIFYKRDVIKNLNKAIVI